MIEVGVLFNRAGEPIFWHLPPYRTWSALPDSRKLWDVIWENRHDLGGFAHSHPGCGVPGPSLTDLTTFVAIEAALGRKLIWWIISEDHAVLCQKLEGEYVFHASDRKPQWLDELRRLSYQHPDEIR